MKINVSLRSNDPVQPTELVFSGQRCYEPTLTHMHVMPKHSISPPATKGIEGMLGATANHQRCPEVLRVYYSTFAVVVYIYIEEQVSRDLSPNRVLSLRCYTMTVSR